MTIKLKDVEIEITDGAKVEISEDGKKITIDAKIDYHYIFNTTTIPYVQPAPLIPSAPIVIWAPTVGDQNFIDKTTAMLCAE